MFHPSDSNLSVTFSHICFLSISIKIKKFAKLFSGTERRLKIAEKIGTKLDEPNI